MFYDNPHRQLKKINGSQSFDQCVMELYQQGRITKETALGAVASESDFMQSLLVD